MLTFGFHMKEIVLRKILIDCLLTGKERDGKGIFKNLFERHEILIRNHIEEKRKHVSQLDSVRKRKPC